MRPWTGHWQVEKRRGAKVAAESADPRRETWAVFIRDQRYATAFGVRILNGV
jgi:hypothetical protein